MAPMAPKVTPYSLVPPDASFPEGLHFFCGSYTVMNGYHWHGAPQDHSWWQVNKPSGVHP